MPGVSFHYRYPFLPLCGALSGGILCSEWLASSGEMLCLSFISAILFFLSASGSPETSGHIYWKRNLRKCADLLAISSVFFLGGEIARPSPLPVPSQTVYQLDVRCEEKLSSNNYILEGQGLRLFLSRFYLSDTFQIGDSLRFQARLRPLRATSNPGEFSYDGFLKQKQVHYKAVPCSPVERTGHGLTMRSAFESLRQTLLEKNARLFPDTANRNLIAALCLGYRNDLDKEMQSLFIQTGTIHLLAVSGLHTGAVYLLLSFLFRLVGIPRRKTFLLAIPLLWGYACLTGLSPSVVRASVILTFIATGQAFERDYTPLNSIAASAFFTLLCQPHLIGSVSFLMSYAAYTGIILGYPLLNSLGRDFSYLPGKLWSLCSLNLSAQIPTLPVAAYYFHTVNAGSLLVNLLAIPLATVILYASLLLLLLPTSVGLFLAPAIDLSCNLLVGILHLFQPVSLNIGGVYPTPVHLAFLYLGLLLFLFFFYRRNKAALYANIAGLCLFLTFACAYNYRLSGRKEVVVFNHYRHSVVLLNYGGHYSLLQNTFADSLKIAPYLAINKLHPLPTHSGLLADGITVKEKTLYNPGRQIHIAGSPDTPIPPDTDILIVTRNVSPEMAFMPANDLPSMVIADGSNSHANISKWEFFCLENDIFFQNTIETGWASIPLK